MAGRPKSDNPARTYTTRLPDALRRKFEYVAEKERRKPTELLRILVEDEVAAYEAKHGEIKLPEDKS
jgi:predicted transcriptional regulator